MPQSFRFVGPTRAEAEATRTRHSIHTSSERKHLRDVAEPKKMPTRRHQPRGMAYRLHQQTTRIRK